MNTKPIIEAQINKALDALFPDGDGVASRAKVEHVLRQTAQVAEHEGRSGALMSLLTTQDVADRLHVTPQWVERLAARAHERFGIGYQARGNNPWLFLPEEIKYFNRVRQARPGRPKIIPSA